MRIWLLMPLMIACSNSSSSSASSGSGLVGSYDDCTTSSTNASLPPQVGGDFSLYPIGSTLTITSDSNSLNMTGGTCGLRITPTDDDHGTIPNSLDCTEVYGDAGASAYIYYANGTVSLSGATLTISMHETLDGAGNQSLTGSADTVTTCTRM